MGLTDRDAVSQTPHQHRHASERCCRMVLALFCLTPSGIMSRMSCCAQHKKLVREQSHKAQKVFSDRQIIVMRGESGGPGWQVQKLQQ